MMMIIMKKEMMIIQILKTNKINYLFLVTGYIYISHYKMKELVERIIDSLEKIKNVKSKILEKFYINF